MRRSRESAVRRVVFAAIVIVGCGDDDVAVRDAGADATDAGARVEMHDITTCDPEYEDICGCIGDFLRCDGSCRCVGDQICGAATGVCRGPDATIGELGEEVFDDCSLSQGALGLELACRSGNVCVFASDSPATRGTCMPPDYCVALSTADPPVMHDVRCLYVDGTPVETGPPAAGECPFSTADVGTYCGGACDDCPDLQRCFGISDARAYGVCVPQATMAMFPIALVCERSDAARSTQLIEICEAYFGEPCACLTPTDRADERTEWGPAIPARVCRDYTNLQPGVECVDVDWEPYF